MDTFDYGQYITAMRRELHAVPELAYREHATQAVLLRELKALGVPFETVGTGVIGRLNAGADKTVAFRADMDALPVTEQNDVPYRSQNAGRMHACGHDGHMAVLLALAKYAARNPEDSAVNAVFIFQPAEESEGGALAMIAGGAMAGADEVYALHVDPAVPAGEARVRAGAMMAGAYEFDIQITGAACHCAEREKGKDALLAGADVLRAVSDGVERAYLGKTMFHAGKIAAGYARNVVADRCEINATLRYFEEKNLQKALEIVRRAVSAAEKRYGVAGEAVKLTQYIPVVCDAACVKKIIRLAGAGEAAVKYTAEDFAFYLQKAPGCLIWLGVKGGGAEKKLHAPDFDFDEKALLCGFGIFQRILKEKIHG